jgi:hypothetical protein
VPSSARRVQARVIVRAPAGELAERVGPWVGTITAIDEASCELETGAETAEGLAAYLGLLGADFSASEPPELVEALRPVGGAIRGRDSPRLSGCTRR